MRRRAVSNQHDWLRNTGILSEGFYESESPLASPQHHARIAIAGDFPRCCDPASNHAAVTLAKRPAQKEGDVIVDKPTCYVGPRTD